MPKTPSMVLSSLSHFSPSFEVSVIIWYGVDKKPISPSAPHASAPLWESSDFLMLDELKINHPFFPLDLSSRTPRGTIDVQTFI